MTAEHARRKATPRARAMMGIAISGAVIIAATAAKGMIPGLGTTSTDEGPTTNAWQGFDQAFGALHTDPDFAPLVMRLRATFPADYTRTKALARRELEGTSGKDLTQAAGHVVVAMVMADMRPLLAKAPDNALAAVADAMAKVSMRLHQGNRETCAAYARSLPGWQAHLSREQTRSLVALALAFLEAGASAQRSPVERQAITYSPADLRQIDTAVRAAGATKRTYELFASGDLANATDAEVCDFVHVLHVSRASLSAALAAKSIAQQVMQSGG